MDTNLTLSCLVVEDSKPAREEMVRIMKKEVYCNISPILEARTVKEALDVIKKNDVDFMILDHSLAGHEMGTTGLDLLKNIPQIDRKIPIIMLTSVDKNTMKEYAEYLTSVNGWLPKLEQLDKPYDNNIAIIIAKILNVIFTKKNVQLQTSLKQDEFIIETKKRKYIRNITDLVKVETKNRILYYHFNNDSCIPSSTCSLSSFLEKYPLEMIRIDRTIAVNKKYIDFITKEKKVYLKQYDKSPVESFFAGTEFYKRIVLMFPQL